MKTFLFLLLLGATPSFAQGVDSLIIDMSDGRRVAIALQDISKITFDSVAARVTLSSDGQGVSILEPSRPNPTEDFTEIAFNVIEFGNASIAIHDLTGKEINRFEIPCLKGRNAFKWSCRDIHGNRIAAGTYMVTVDFNGSQASTKVIISR